MHVNDWSFSSVVFKAMKSTFFNLDKFLSYCKPHKPIS